MWRLDGCAEAKEGGEQIKNVPVFDDFAVADAAVIDAVKGAVLSGRVDAKERGLEGGFACEIDGDEVVFCKPVLNGIVHVGKGVEDCAKPFLERSKVNMVAGTGMMDIVWSDEGFELVEGVLVPEFEPFEDEGLICLG